MLTSLARRAAAHNLRRLPQPRVDFASNDSLGLARSPLLASLVDIRLGSTGSRLLTGNSHAALALEEQIASFHGSETALLFSCGYMANIALLSILGEALVLYDQAIHASTRDGMRLGSSTTFPFRHNDLDHLEKRLQNPLRPCYIAVESLYSTDGTFAPLKELQDLAQKYDAHLLIDEAHTVGLYGPQGRGLASPQTYARVVTFGKALGVHGAAILCSHQLKEALINLAHPAIYSTALPYYALAAIESSYSLFPTMERERLHLKSLISLCPGLSHIQPFIVPGNEAVKEKRDHLARLGFDVNALTSPTVRRGEESLRLVLHSFNTKQEVEQCLTSL